MFSLYFINILLILVTMKTTVSKLPSHFVNKIGHHNVDRHRFGLHSTHYIFSPHFTFICTFSTYQFYSRPKFYGNRQNKEIRTYIFILMTLINMLSICSKLYYIPPPIWTLRTSRSCLFAEVKEVRDAITKLISCLQNSVNVYRREGKKQAVVFGSIFALSQAAIYWMFAGTFRLGAHLVAEGEITAIGVCR